MGTLSMLIEAARVAQLYRSGKIAYLASPVYAAVLILVLWGPITAGVLFAWFAVMLAVSIGRVAIHLRYVRAAHDAASAPRWEKIFAAGALADSLAGVLSLLLSPAEAAPSPPVFAASPSFSPPPDLRA